MDSGMTTMGFQRDGLVILAGPSGCGKSFWAARCFDPGWIVSSDRCRQMICDDAARQEVSHDAFDLFYALIGYRLKYGRPTVADATNLAAPYRSQLRRIAERFGRPVYLVWFDTTLAECLRHNDLRDRRVEPAVIREQWQRFDASKPALQAEAALYREVHRLTPAGSREATVELIDIPSPRPSPGPQPIDARRPL
mgnify:CR=1 FL=1